MSDHTHYESPLASRYASKEMSYLFSPQYKATTWRRLWVALARAEKALGLPITDKQLHLLEDNIHNIDFENIALIEKEIRHDVMAHIHAYGDQCPAAKGIIHLGATSSYVTDNTDLIQMQEGLKLLRPKLVSVIRHLSQFAQETAALPCLSYTHFQAAQPTTMGKRACLWIQDLLFDVHDLESRLSEIRFLGVKGATGTQASFLALFEGNTGKVKRLDELVAEELGFAGLYTIASQTYPRKVDMRLFSVLTGIAASAHKMATDIRLLSHLKEIEEPFSDSQVGSSAMPYKRNPMKCERVCGLARYLISLAENPAYNASNQWLERTLDDSSNRRITIPEAFLSADSILSLLVDITQHLAIYPQMIAKHLHQDLPFIAAENILMAAVKKGKNREQIHEKLRIHAFATSKEMKREGKENDFLQRLSNDPDIGLSRNELEQIAAAKNFIGRAQEQVSEFFAHEVSPVLTRYHDLKPYIPRIEV